MGDVHIVGLDHIQLAMPPGEEARARWFYGELLGLTEVAKPAALAQRGGCWFRGEQVKVHLGVQPDFAPARKAHPAFRVKDLDACLRALEAAQLVVFPERDPPHMRRFHVQDPFGNRIEFIQADDAFLPVQ